MGVVASKGDNNSPLLNLCKERKDLIKAARDARYQLAKSHLVYFRSLSDFTKILNKFVHDDLVVIPDSSDDDSSACDLNCSASGSDSDSDSECLVCDGSQTASSNKNRAEQGLNPEFVPLSSKDPQKPVLTSNKVEFTSAPAETVVIDPHQSSSFIKQSNFPDILGLYEMPYNTQCSFTEHDQRDEDAYREIREREGIPDLEPDSDHDHHSLVRKNQKKMKKKKKKKKTKNVEESSSSSAAGEVDKKDIKFKNVVAENDKHTETSAEETGETPEIVTEMRRPDEEFHDEAYDSSSSSESSGSGSTDLRSIVKKINCLSEKAVSINSEVSKLLEASKVVHHQPLGDQFRGFASRVLGSSGNSTRSSLSVRGPREENSAGSLSVTLEKLYTWEKKLYAEVTQEERLRVLYDKGYKMVRSLDQSGAESSKIDEAEAAVTSHLSNINVSVRAVKSISMRIHDIRDKELLFHVTEIINGFKQQWRLLAKCHRKQFRAIARSKCCVHFVEKRASSRKATHKVEEEIRRYRESLRGYIHAQKGLVEILNEWLNRNIMEKDENESEAPEIFRVCSEWLREIVSVDEVKVLSAVEEMEQRFRGLGLKQAEEEKQRMRTERLSKELERNTKELEAVSDSTPVGPELLHLREIVTQEKEKHERLMRELNDTVSMSLQKCLVSVFKALEDFCFGHFKASQNIGIVSREAPFLSES